MSSLTHGGRWAQVKVSTLERLRRAARDGDFGQVNQLLDDLLDFGRQSEYRLLQDEVYQRWKAGADDAWYKECRERLESLIL